MSKGMDFEDFEGLFKCMVAIIDAVKDEGTMCLLFASTKDS
jgi:hypothetical protein